MLKNKFNPLFAPHDDQPPANAGNGNGSEPQTEDAPEKAEESKEREKTNEEEPPPVKEPEAPSETLSAATPLSAFERGKLRALGMGGLISRLETSEAALATANAEITRLHAENTRINTELAEKPKQIEAATKGRENEVSQGVLAELGKLGISEAAAPSQISADATPEALLEKFQSLKGAEKTAFFRANKTALKNAEAAKTAK
jgi:hypothetical protein